MSIIRPLSPSYLANNQICTFVTAFTEAQVSGDFYLIAGSLSRPDFKGFEREVLLFNGTDYIVQERKVSTTIIVNGDPFEYNPAAGWIPSNTYSANNGGGGNSGGGSTLTATDVQTAMTNALQSQAQTELTETVLQDSNDTYFIRRVSLNEETGTVTTTYLDLLGNTITLASLTQPISPVKASEIVSNTVLYETTTAFTGASIGDTLALLSIYDASSGTILGSYWSNRTTGLTITAPSAANITILSDNTENEVMGLRTQVGSATDALSNSGDTSSLASRVRGIQATAEEQLQYVSSIESELGSTVDPPADGNSVSGTLTARIKNIQLTLSDTKNAIQDTSGSSVSNIQTLDALPITLNSTFDYLYDSSNPPKGSWICFNPISGDFAPIRIYVLQGAGLNPILANNFQLYDNFGLPALELTSSSTGRTWFKTSYTDFGYRFEFLDNGNGNTGSTTIVISTHLEPPFNPSGGIASLENINSTGFGEIVDYFKRNNSFTSALPNQAVFNNIVNNAVITQAVGSVSSIYATNPTTVAAHWIGIVAGTDPLVSGTTPLLLSAYVSGTARGQTLLDEEYLKCFPRTLGYQVVRSTNPLIFTQLSSTLAGNQLIRTTTRSV